MGIQASALVKHGHIFMHMHRPSEASNLFTDAVARYQQLADSDAPHRQRHREAAAACYFHLARANREMDNYNEAIKCYGKYLEIDPDCPPALNNRGDCYVRLGRYDLARYDIEKAVELVTDDYRPHRSLAFLYRAEGDYQKAFDAFTHAIDLRPAKSPKYYSFRAEMSFLMGRYGDAMNDYRTALELDAEYGPANAGMAIILSHDALETSEIELACALADKATQCEDSEDRAVGTVALGIVLYRQGRFEEATELLRNAFDLDPRMCPLVRTGGLHLAMSLWALGKHDDAREVQQRAVEWMDHFDVHDPHTKTVAREAVTLLGLREEEAVRACCARALARSAEIAVYAHTVVTATMNTAIVENNATLSLRRYLRRITPDSGGRHLADLSACFTSQRYIVRNRRRPRKLTFQKPHAWPICI